MTLATLLSAMSFASAVKTGTVTALSGLRVRAAASTSSAALGVLPQRSNVVILEDAGDWYKIEYNNKQAYVSALMWRPARSPIRLWQARSPRPISTCARAPRHTARCWAEPPKTAMSS